MNPAAVSAFFSSCHRTMAGHHQKVRSIATGYFAKVQTQLAAQRAAQLARDRTEASELNVFQWIKPDENSLSDIFAHLLDAEGEHGQGPLFLQELLRVAGVVGVERLDQAQAWLEEDTWLIDNPLRRVDIVVRLPRFGIAIANKPWASDSVDQLADHVQYMRRRFGKRFVFFCWSGQGVAPSSLRPDERERLERMGHCVLGVIKVKCASGWRHASRFVRPRKSAGS